MQDKKRPFQRAYLTRDMPDDLRAAMVGFFAQLSEDQQADALAFEGNHNIGASEQNK